MKILRWLVSVPAGMFAGWLVIYSAIAILGRAADRMGTAGLYLLLFFAVISGAVFVYVSAAIAPSYKKVLAWVLATASVAALMSSAPEVLAERWIYIAQNVGCVAMATLISLDVPYFALKPQVRARGS